VTAKKSTKHLLELFEQILFFEHFNLN
jgi:hypothetical protein